jgi:NAD(P)-dependent dehydrogenase (short-subunit alcohol dehydrogenase family)
MKNESAGGIESRLSDPAMHGKTILITGATSGIGLEAAVELARRGARVVMVGRDPGRTEAAGIA